MWVCRTIAISPCGREALTAAGRRSAERRRMSAGRDSRATDGDEVERLVEVGICLRAQGEIAGCDRRREPVVEGLGQAQARVDRIPAELERKRMVLQLARVEQPVHLDTRKRAASQLRELLGAVLVHVPRIVRALSALGS